MAENLAGYTKTCAEGDELQEYGADCTGCMTVDTYENALHPHLNVSKRKMNQRNGECACLLGTDIGAYDTCGHLCKYCYANSDKDAVRMDMRNHNPKSPFLIGELQSTDVIHEAKQSSWLDQQMSIFDFTKGE